MNFISKLTKKPSKTNMRPKKQSKHRSEEDEYIEVELEVADEERPPVPLFIGSSGGPADTTHSGGADFDDEFFDGAVEDDLELGEEANMFYDKQRHNNLQQQHFDHNSSFHRHTFSGPAAGSAPEHMQYPPYPAQAPIPQQTPVPVSAEPMSQYMGAQPGFQPPSIMIPGGYMAGQMAVDSPMAAGGLYFQGGVASSPAAATPMLPMGAMHPAAASMNVPTNNYLGLTDLEMLEFHQLIANGVHEMEAIRTIQYNRLIHPPAVNHQRSSLSRTSSGIPPQVAPSVAALNEDDHVYQTIIKESIEEEQRRQQRMRAAKLQNADNDLTPDEALSIALQQSYDEYERMKRGSRSGGSVSVSQSFGSPTNSSSMGVSRSASKSSKVMSSIEKANEDALRQAILLSMQEANMEPAPPSSASKRPSGSTSAPSSSAYTTNSTMNTPKSTLDATPYDPRMFSTTRSGSSDRHDYLDYGLVPEHQRQVSSPYVGSSQGAVEPPYRPHHHEYFAAPPTSSSHGSGQFSPMPSATGGATTGATPRQANAATPRDANAAQMILARRGQPHSFYGGEIGRSRSSDGQEQPRNRRPFQSMPSIDVNDADHY